MINTDKKISHLLKEIKFCDKEIAKGYLDSTWDVMKCIYEKELQQLLMEDE